MATAEEKDELLMQFLGMTDDKVDPEVAVALLEANNYNLQAAVDQLFGNSPTSGAARAPDSAPGNQATMMQTEQYGALIGPNARQSEEDRELQQALAASRDNW